MKRMSEVFKLPVEANQVYVSPNLIEYGKMDDAAIRDVLTHAAHAINHVDALADALEMMLSENLTMSKWLSDNYWDAEDSENFKQAKKALAAYRGEK